MIPNPAQLVLASACVVLAGCGSGITGGGLVCTAEARASITVDVRDSVTNAVVSRNARIIARMGAVADTSRDTGAFDGPFGLFYERAGTFDVTVEQTGYKTWSRQGVQVTQGTCHVNGVALTARLQR